MYAYIRIKLDFQDHIPLLTWSPRQLMNRWCIWTGPDHRSTKTATVTQFIFRGAHLIWKISQCSKNKPTFMIWSQGPTAPCLFTAGRQMELKDGHSPHLSTQVCIFSLYLFATGLKAQDHTRCLLWIFPAYESKPWGEFYVFFHFLLSREHAWVSFRDVCLHFSYCLSHTEPEKVMPAVSNGHKNDSINVTWDPPRGNIEKYVVTLYNLQGPNSTQELNNTAQSCLFVNLKAGRMYTVTVRTRSGPFVEESLAVSVATCKYPAAICSVHQSFGDTRHWFQSIEMVKDLLVTLHLKEHKWYIKLLLRY